MPDDANTATKVREGAHRTPGSTVQGSTESCEAGRRHWPLRDLPPQTGAATIGGQLAADPVPAGSSVAITVAASGRTEWQAASSFPKQRHPQARLQLRALQ